MANLVLFFCKYPLQSVYLTRCNVTEGAGLSAPEYKNNIYRVGGGVGSMVLVV